MSFSLLNKQDPQVSTIIKSEVNRQRSHLVLIASENVVSAAVLAAEASVFTNKYAEGYSGNRYYGGCEFVDQVEDLAISRARLLFSAEHVNVQAHSGSSANLAAYLAVMKPGDTLLGMRLAHGGHLTHGSPVSFSGRIFKAQTYGVCRDTELLDYDDLLAKAEEFRPRVIIAGGSSYAQIIDFAKFRQAADLAGATLIVDMAQFAGLVAAGLYPSPVAVADMVTSTTHKTLRGPRGGLILSNGALGSKVDAQIFPGVQGGPLMHIIAAKAVAFGEALAPEFVDYQKQVIVNAQRLADNLAGAGFRLVSGGTSTHLVLVDLRNKNITGKMAESALDKAGLAANKNAIPYDPLPPGITSGLRLGTPTLTSRGLKEADMDLVTEFITEALQTPDAEGRLKKIRDKVAAFCANFPLFTDYENM